MGFKFGKKNIISASLFKKIYLHSHESFRFIEERIVLNIMYLQFIYISAIDYNKNFLDGLENEVKLK